jgi:hypothetical protein
MKLLNLSRGARLKFFEFSRRYQGRKLRHTGEYATTKPLASDTDIARNLSEGPAVSSFPQPHWLGPISYPNALPAELHEPEHAFEENGMTFWTLKD